MLGSAKSTKQRGWILNSYPQRESYLQSLFSEKGIDGEFLDRFLRASQRTLGKDRLSLEDALQCTSSAIGTSEELGIPLVAVMRIVIQKEEGLV